MRWLVAEGVLPRCAEWRQPNLFFPAFFAFAHRRFIASATRFRKAMV